MYVLTGSLDTTLRVWNIENGEELMILTGHSASVTALSVSPDGRYVASGALDWTVRVWDLKDSTVLRVLSGHSEVRRSMVFNNLGVLGVLRAPPPLVSPPLVTPSPDVTVAAADICYVLVAADQLGVLQ